MKKSTTAVIDEENSAACGSENQHPGNGHSNLRAGRANRGYNPKYDSATYLVDGQPGSVPLQDRTNTCIGAGGSAPKTEQSFMKTRQDHNNTTPEQICNRSSPLDSNPKDFVAATKTCSTQILNSEANVTPGTSHQSKHHHNSGMGNQPQMSETPSNIGIVAPFAVTGPLPHSNEYEQAIDESCTDSENDDMMGRKPIGGNSSLTRRKSQQKLIVKGPWTEAEDWKVL